MFHLRLQQIPQIQRQINLRLFLALSLLHSPLVIPRNMLHYPQPILTLLSLIPKSTQTILLLPRLTLLMVYAVSANSFYGAIPYYSWFGSLHRDDRTRQQVVAGLQMTNVFSWSHHDTN